MAENLLIVESPSKARTLQSYLGADYKIMASVGHIKDLPKNKLGVDIENDFQPHYEIIKGKEKVVKELKKEGAKAKRIYLAPDPDREGEAIAWHIKEEISGSEEEDNRFYRVLFNEITKKAILEALKNPQALNRARYQSQLARRILDRLVGYLISPLLWQKVKGGLSAGRVQSVALKMICEREREIFAFVPLEYWSLTAALKAQLPPEFEAKLVRFRGEKLDKPKKELIEEAFEHVQGKEFIVTACEKKKVKKSPPLPFITSTLQQEAFKTLGFSAKKTMTIAQQLYEGIDLGERGIVGLITYMRTDSTRLAEEAVAQARGYIQRLYGKDYVPAKPYTYKVKGTMQDAHEAIRPTDLELRPEEVSDYLTKEQLGLYTLIWKRFLASQMAPAIFEQLLIEITAGEAIFRATGSSVIFRGFMEAYQEAEEAEEKEGHLPIVKEGDKLVLMGLKKQQHFTQPPNRYTEATLIKALEENGIGRPSTYATILSNILERKYVEKEKKHLKPTEMGFLVNDMLQKGFPRIMDIKFTAKMEEELDKIEKGELSWIQVIGNFYKTFERELNEAQKTLKAEIPTEVPCPLCGAPMVIRGGKTGIFLGCSRFPECKGTAAFERDESGNIQILGKEEEKESGEICPNCGNPLIKKKGRYGPFLACKAYPNCKFTRSLNEQQKEMKCPKEGCTGTLVLKRSKGGRRFYGCSRYPDCDFVSWKRPDQV